MMSVSSDKSDLAVREDGATDSLWHLHHSTVQA